MEAKAAWSAGSVPLSSGGGLLSPCPGGADGHEDVERHQHRADQVEQAAQRAHEIVGVQHRDAVGEGVLEEAELVVGPPHQALGDARHPHCGDVENDGDRRDPEVPFDEAMRPERRAPEPRHQIVDRAEDHEGDPAERTRMHVPDGPVGVVAERVDRLDRHQRPLEGRHAVEGDGDDEEAQDRVCAQFPPGARQGHDPVDHAAPGRDPEHDREGGAERLRPVRQRAVVEMVRAGPDIEEDQRPEMDDGEPVGIDRALGLLGDEIVHHPDEAGRQEEADHVVAVPPLDQRILDARELRVALRPDEGDRHRQIVDDVQDRDRDDEGEIEPVRNVDVRLAAAGERAGIDREIDQPDRQEQQVGVPFRLGVFLALGDTERVAGHRQDQEKLVAEEDQHGELAPAP